MSFMTFGTSGRGDPSSFIAVEPLTSPIDAVVHLPGSKSMTNRALLCAALADGRSTLRSKTGPILVSARDSGTTSRFILPAVALASARSLVDGSDQLRGRPFGPLLDALRQLGAAVEDLGEPGFLPVAVTGPLRGGKVELPGHLSSQFLSGLMLAAPLMPDGLGRSASMQTSSASAPAATTGPTSPWSRTRAPPRTSSLPRS